MKKIADLFKIKPTDDPFVKKLARLLIWPSYAFFIFAGLYGSLKVAITLFNIEPDVYHSVILWSGIKVHGLTWIKDWVFTQDNWLFSLVPLNFIGFLLFAGKPTLVVLACGWLIFVLSAFTSGLLAWQFNAKRSAFLIPLTLLFLGLYAHITGFVSYSTSHNVTNLFGLVSLLLLVKWVQKQKNTTLIFILLLLVAGAVSDPWMVASYNLPIGLVGIVLLVYPPARMSRFDCIKLLLTSAVSIIAVKSHLFGLLNFLSDMHFQFGGWGTVKNNSIYLIKDLGGLLNISPFRNIDGIIPAVISIGTIALLLFTNIAIVLRRNNYPEKGLLVFLAFSFFSIGGILLAFILSSVEAANYSGRFLLNCLYLAIIALGVLTDINWERLSKTLRIFSAALLVLFLVSGISSTFEILKSPVPSLKSDEINNLIDFLRKNKLTYGYGPYWGSNANAVTVLSKSEIRIRPVAFSKDNGMIMGDRGQSSRRWYRAEDWPPGQKEYFVFVKSGKEEDECADVDLCIKGLSMQFGDPGKILAYGDATILVWDHPLLGNHQLLKKITLGEAIHFNQQNFWPMWLGWSSPEELDTWSDGDTASVFLALSSTPQNDLELLIDGHAFLADKHPFQEVDIIVNQHPVATLKYDLQSNTGVRVVKIPKALTMEKNGQLMINFNFKNPKSPAELGMSTDHRRLGLAIASLELKTAR